MTDLTARITTLTADLVRLDSRSFISNLPVADRIEAELAGFEIERLDYTDPAGVAKRVLVAHRGGPGGIAFSGHMDTVPDTGWTTDPWSARVDADGVMVRDGKQNPIPHPCLELERQAQRALNELMRGWVRR